MKNEQFEFSVISIETARACIRSGNALAKMIRSSSHDYRCWQYLLDQVRDPRNFRPIKPIDEKKIDRDRIFDTVTGEWKWRRVSSQKRGRSKPEKTNTKSLATTLVPPEPSDIELYYYSIGESIGIFWDSTRCRIKPSRVFPHNVNSDTKPWLKRRGDPELPHPELLSIPFADLQDQLRNLNKNDYKEESKSDKNQIRKKAQQNEVLAQLNRDAAIGVFAAQDNLIHRMGALALQAKIFASLNKIVPAFLVTSQLGLLDYSPHQQRQDIQSALKFPEHHPARLYAKTYFRDFTPPEEYLVYTQRKLGDITTLNADVLSVVVDYLGFADWNRVESTDFPVRKKPLENNDIELQVWCEKLLEMGFPMEFPSDEENPYTGKLFFKNEAIIKKIIKDGIESDSYYQDNMKLVNQCIAYNEQFSGQALLPLLNDALSRHRYVNPIISTLLGSMYISVMSDADQKEINRFVSLMLRCSKTYDNSVGFLLEYQNLFEYSEKIKIYADVHRMSGEESYYVKSLFCQSESLSCVCLASLLNPDILEKLYHHRPQEIVIALKQLASLDNLVNRYDSVKFYWESHTPSDQCVDATKISREMLDQAKIRLLLALESYPSLDYSYTNSDKRSLGNYLRSQIVSMKNIEELIDFYGQQKQRKYLKNIRHPRYDKCKALLSDSSIISNLEQEMTQAVTERMRDLLLPANGISLDPAQDHPLLLNQLCREQRNVFSYWWILPILVAIEAVYLGEKSLSLFLRVMGMSSWSSHLVAIVSTVFTGFLIGCTLQILSIKSRKSLNTLMWAVLLTSSIVGVPMAIECMPIFIANWPVFREYSTEIFAAIVLLIGVLGGIVAAGKCYYNQSRGGQFGFFLKPAFSLVSENKVQSDITSEYSVVNFN